MSELYKITYILPKPPRNYWFKNLFCKYILAQMCCVGPSVDMEHSIVGPANSLMLNLALFVMHISQLSHQMIWGCGEWAQDGCIDLFFLCKKGHSSQKFCHWTSFLRIFSWLTTILTLEYCANLWCRSFSIKIQDGVNLSKSWV